MNLFFLENERMNACSLHISFLGKVCQYFIPLGKPKNVMCLYSRVIVSGASGAVSRNNKLQSKADQIRALVYLEAKETLFISVGQMGSSACQYTGVSQKIFSMAFMKIPF